MWRSGPCRAHMLHGFLPALTPLPHPRKAAPRSWTRRSRGRGLEQGERLPSLIHISALVTARTWPQKVQHCVRHWASTRVLVTALPVARARGLPAPVPAHCAPSLPCPFQNAPRRGDCRVASSLPFLEFSLSLRFQSTPRLCFLRLSPALSECSPSLRLQGRLVPILFGIQPVTAIPEHASSLGSASSLPCPFRVLPVATIAGSPRPYPFRNSACHCDSRARLVFGFSVVSPLPSSGLDTPLRFQRGLFPSLPAAPV
ncbi:uncharacterized protein CMC5_045210 [Chondromyces crocatus]|uniref:Uncharacterized protein n=1 Tax=Chondromyces crocatus TaxID=52 RepID=A0A0K1EIE6_CHOCO|nr:uncharacterized protein CMC5_045210 [Chondromyces crocatus]